VVITLMVSVDLKSFLLRAVSSVGYIILIVLTGFWFLASGFWLLASEFLFSPE